MSSSPSRRARKVGLGAVLLSGAMMLAALPGSASAGGAEGTRPIRACESLLAFTFNDGSRITSAKDVPANGNTPSYCQVSVLAPERINIAVLLPNTNWNGRYRAEGGGVYEGVLLPPTGDVAQGWAASATDTGHQSALLTGEWAWSPAGPNYHQIQDFGYRANHEQAVKSKALVEAYYGVAPDYSYWNGCSSGGRGGLTEAMKYPNDFDGILAASPAINWTRFIPAEFWPEMAMMKAGNWMPASKLTAFTQAALKAGDGSADGVKDGLVDHRFFSFDPKTLIGQETSGGTITASDAEVVQQIWDGPRAQDGRFLWYGLEPGTPLGSLAGTTNGPDGKPVDGNPFLVASEWLKWFIHKDPSWDWHLETYDQFVKDFDQSVEEWDYALGTNIADLGGFRDAGGKVIVWHGLADPLIFADGSIDYYSRVVQTMGGLAKTREFARFFVAPNVGHCGGGTGPSPTGAFQLVMDWVEKGQAPATLPATLAPKTGVNQSDVPMKRNLCMWPDVPTYRGGPITDAESFGCAARSAQTKQAKAKKGS